MLDSWGPFNRRWLRVARLKVEMDAEEPVVRRVLAEWSEQPYIDFDPGSLQAIADTFEAGLEEVRAEGYPEAMFTPFKPILSLPLRHEFSIESHDEGVTVTEELYAGTKWLYGGIALVLTSAIALSVFYLWLVLGYNVLDRVSFIPTSFVFMLVIVFGVLFGMSTFMLPNEMGFLIPDDVLSQRSHRQSWVTTKVAVGFVAGGYLMLWGLALGSVILGAFSLLVFTGLIGVLAFKLEWLQQFRFAKSLPSPGMEYLTFSIHLLVPLLVYFLGGRFLTVLDVNADVGHILQPFVLFGIALGLPEYLANRFDTEVEESTAFIEFKTGARYVQNRWSHLIGVAIAVVLPLTLVVVSFELGSTFWTLLTMPASQMTFPTFPLVPGARLVSRSTLVTATRVANGLGLIGLAIPIVVLGTGLLYQVGSTFFRLGRLVLQSEPYDQAVEHPDDLSIRIVPTDAKFASSFSLPPLHLVFISDRVVDDLDDEALAALIAHEEAHIRHGDAVLPVIVPVIATVLLLGKNVIFAGLDFRHREYRADAYAVSTVGRPAVDSLLSYLDDGTVDPIEIRDRSVGGRLRRRLIPTQVSTYIRLFFGHFAVAQAHPSVPERRAALYDEERG